MVPLRHHVETRDREWRDHPRLRETIEWLEIQPDPRWDDIISILRKIGAPISSEGGRTRIRGWLRDDRRTNPWTPPAPRCITK